MRRISSALSAHFGCGPDDLCLGPRHGVKLLFVKLVTANGPEPLTLIIDVCSRGGALPS